ncbi:hypothetical protein B7486_72100, partial [cyanobacterium TDX16]
DLVRSSVARSRREAARAERPPRPESTPPGDAGDDTWTLLSRLPLPQRQVITLAYLGGHSYAEVAALLAQPLGTVKSRVRAGLATLQELIVEEREAVEAHPS